MVYSLRVTHGSQVRCCCCCSTGRFAATVGVDCLVTAPSVQLHASTTRIAHSSLSRSLCGMSSNAPACGRLGVTGRPWLCRSLTMGASCGGATGSDANVKCSSHGCIQNPISKCECLMVASQEWSTAPNFAYTRRNRFDDDVHESHCTHGSVCRENRL